MELEALKKEWSKHNEYLKKQHMINEELLRKLNLDSLKKELSLPYKTEVGALIALVICTLILLPRVYQLWGNTYYFLSGISCLVVTIGGAIIASIKVKAFASIDLYGAPIVKLQSDLTKLRQTIYSLVKFELLCILFLLLGLPALMKVYKNKELFELNLPSLSIMLAVCLLVVGPLIAWMFKRLYGERIKRANHHLNEIEKFKVEVKNTGNHD